MAISEEEPQVFSALQKYGSGAPENYLTESFVYLIRLLIQRDRDTGIELLNLLAGKSNWFTREDIITVQTQVPLHDLSATYLLPSMGTKVAVLDIKVEQEERLLYIEVKHDSSLGEKQLERDFDHLEKTNKAQKQLLLLSRSKSDALATTLSPDKFHHVCWYEIHNLLATQAEHDPVCAYFVRSFVQFLEEKSMSLTPVKSVYLDGVKGLLNLTQMIEAAFAHAVPDIKTKRIAGWLYRGLAFAQYWCGFRYDKPWLIVFENNVSRNPSYHRALDVRESGFFVQSGDEQFEHLVHFFRQAYRDAPVLVSDVVVEQSASISEGEIIS